LPNSASLNGSRIRRRTLSPLGSSPLPDPQFQRINSAGKKKEESYESTHRPVQKSNYIGWRVLFANTTGSGNTAIGQQALAGNKDGNNNTAIGQFTLGGQHGNNNTFVGYRAGMVGDENIVLGSCNGSGTCPGEDIESANNAILIGTGHLGPPAELGEEVSNSCFIGNIFQHPVGEAALPVMIDGFDRLGTEGSSRRLKKEIKPMEHASEAILGLKPVTFHYKRDRANTPRFGLIAEEVAEVNPDLVVRDKNGEIYGVRYDSVNAMLLNEFLKEHRKNEEQGATIARLQKQVEALTAGLQKVSAQIEATKLARQVVNNQ
jgi:hypothetical protein